MTIRSVLAPVALILALSIPTRLHAGAAYNDGNFTNYNWTSSIILDTTAGQTGVASAGLVSTGGATGQGYFYNQFSFTVSGSPSTQGVLIANLSTNLIYNPAASGLISNVSYSIEGSNIVASGAAESISIGLLLYQNGTYYGRMPGYAGDWIPVKEQTLVASSFIKLSGSGPSFPDFSRTGAPIEFGFLTSASVTSASSTSTACTLGVDLFSLSLANLPVPVFIKEQRQQTNAAFTLSGLAPGETVTWLASTNMVSWITNSVIAATDTNAVFTFTNAANSPTNTTHWFLNALVQ